MDLRKPEVSLPADKNKAVSPPADTKLSTQKEMERQALLIERDKIKRSWEAHLDRHLAGI